MICKSSLRFGRTQGLRPTCELSAFKAQHFTAEHLEHLGALSNSFKFNMQFWHLRISSHHSGDSGATCSLHLSHSCICLIEKTYMFTCYLPEVPSFLPLSFLFPSSFLIRKHIKKMIWHTTKNKPNRIEINKYNQIYSNIIRYNKI